MAKILSQKVLGLKIIAKVLLHIIGLFVTCNSETRNDSANHLTVTFGDLVFNNE